MGDEGREQSRQTREIAGISTETAQNPAHGKHVGASAVAFSRRAMLPAGDVLDPELQKIVAAWPKLSEPLRQAMLAIVASAKPD